MTMRIAVFCLCLLIGDIAGAQVPQTSPKQAVSAAPSRTVRGRILISEELPSAELTFSADYDYAGGRVVTLYGKAEAEQHIFVKVRDGRVQSFYWVQFEHFLPDNNLTYNYKPDRTTDVGDLQFIYDTKGFSDYASDATSDPASDGAAVGRLLAKHKLSFPAKTARVRMFHLPAPDRRAELMIIYGEALPENSTVPASSDGVELDSSSPAAAGAVLERMRQGLSIRKVPAH